ncbi:hypothetical protein Dimus_004731 [Dionaea muscipula]
MFDRVCSNLSLLSFGTLDLFPYFVNTQLLMDLSFYCSLLSVLDCSIFDWPQFAILDLLLILHARWIVWLFLLCEVVLHTQFSYFDNLPWTTEVITNGIRVCLELFAFKFAVVLGFCPNFDLRIFLPRFVCIFEVDCFGFGSDLVLCELWIWVFDIWGSFVIFDF